MRTMDDTVAATLIEVPILEERPWAVFAACREVGDVNFFPQSKAEERAAIEICTMCPVREDCLEHALATNERFGIWGGTTDKERRKLARRR